jgi:acyl-CoA reductase-like NAD-dependent aldehyde dehydrogenase
MAQTQQSSPPVHAGMHYIGGEWLESTGAGSISVINSASESVMGSIPAGSEIDIDRAVSAARAALPVWSGMSLAARVELLERVGAELSARGEELALLITGELGMPLHLTRTIQVASPARAFSTIGAHAERIAWEQTNGRMTVVREPLGVVGAITPWNFPLEQISVKIAPAMVAGCTVVLKPSEVTPLNALVLAEVADEVGLPAGVLNIVNGFGPVAGEALAAHNGIDALSFTGSTRAGRRVSVLAGGNVKPVTVELGGKSPNVILDDAPLEQAVTAGVDSCYFNAGQTCSALTRMLVPRERLAEVEQLAVAAAQRYVVGDPLDDETTIGPLVSAVQRERVRGFIESGIAEGAELLLGGVDAPAGLDRGFFVAPTIFSGVRNEMRIAQEEIFGPVLSVIPYDGDEEAVRLANDTRYGLAAAVWSGDEQRAMAVARGIRAGQVIVNGGDDDPTAPFGGFKESGHGRENGAWGIEGFVAPKAMLR